jgi:hypothetical protein
MTPAIFLAEKREKPEGEKKMKQRVKPFLYIFLARAGSRAALVWMGKER